MSHPGQFFRLLIQWLYTVFVGFLSLQFLEAAKKVDKKLTLVPIVLLFRRSWGMLRFCIYLTSSVIESESTRKAQHILLCFQVSVAKDIFVHCVRVKYKTETRGREENRKRVVAVQAIFR